MIRDSYWNLPASWAPYIVHGEPAGLTEEGELLDAKNWRPDPEITEIRTVGEVFDGVWYGKPRKLVRFHFHYKGPGI